MASAQELLHWNNQRSNQANITWAVGGNFRFLESFLQGARKVNQMGRILGFKTAMTTMVKPGSKYYETSWRKTPTYQGGFLLDGGVHFIAGTRILLGEISPTTVSACTAQIQPHLPPVDTVDAVWKLSNGASGTFSVSFGTTFSGSEYSVACEKGTVSIGRGFITTKDLDGKEERTNFPNEGNGVLQEVRAWAEGILEGKMNERQSPAEALKDLEILEAMLSSGEKGGIPVNVDAQDSPEH